jgi:hypothetical protein
MHFMRYNSVLLSSVLQTRRDNKGLTTSFFIPTAAVEIGKSELNSQFDWNIT